MDGAAPHQTGGVGNPAAAEAVGEDLIGDALAKPGGDGLRTVVYSELIGSQLLLAPVQPLQLKGIPHQAHIALGVQLGGEDVLAQLKALPGHGKGEGFVVPAFKPGGDRGVGKALGPGRAERKAYRCAGRYGSIGAFIALIPGIVGRLIGQRDHSK